VFGSCRKSDSGCARSRSLSYYVGSTGLQDVSGYAIAAELHFYVGHSYNSMLTIAEHFEKLRKELEKSTNRR
jgi:hypothetical protein